MSDDPFGPSPEGDKFLADLLAKMDEQHPFRVVLRDEIRTAVALGRDDQTDMARDALAMERDGQRARAVKAEKERDAAAKRAGRWHTRYNDLLMRVYNHQDRSDNWYKRWKDAGRELVEWKSTAEGAADMLRWAEAERDEWKHALLLVANIKTIIDGEQEIANE